MILPASGPFLFDTSAESWIGRSRDAAVNNWMQEYLSLHEAHVSAATVMERIRGYALLSKRVHPERRQQVELLRVAYLKQLGTVWAIDTAIATLAAEIAVLLPNPPSPARRGHHLAESRQDRLVRWRFDAIIAATALSTHMTLVHNNAADFESIRRAIEIVPERFPGLGPLALTRCDSLVG
jgi:predicted nucleic acid-binding protein